MHDLCPLVRIVDYFWSYVKFFLCMYVMLCVIDHTI